MLNMTTGYIAWGQGGSTNKNWNPRGKALLRGEQRMWRVLIRSTEPEVAECL